MPIQRSHSGGVPPIPGDDADVLLGRILRAPALSAAVADAFDAATAGTRYSDALPRGLAWARSPGTDPAARVADALADRPAVDVLVALLLVIARDPPDTTVSGANALDAIRSLDDRHAAELLLPLAAQGPWRLREPASRVLPLLGGAVVEPAVSMLAREPGLARPISAVVAETGAAAVPPLLKLVESEPLLRRPAIELLGQIGDEQAVRPLAALVREQPMEIASAALRAIGRIGGAQAVQALAGFAADGSPAIRAATARAAGNLPPRAAVPSLLGLLADPEPRVRHAAQEALGHAGERGLDHLRLRLDPRAREFHPRHAEILSHFGQPATGMLLESLDHPGAEVRLAALSSLRLLALRDQVGTDSVPRLLDRLGEDVEAPVRAAAADVLGELVRPRYDSRPRVPAEVRESLLAALVDGDPRVRAASARALALAGEPTALEPLAAMLVKPREPARAAIAEALVRLSSFGHRGAIEAVLREVDHPAARVRRAVLRAISRAFRPDDRWVWDLTTWEPFLDEIVPALVRRTTDRDPPARASAVRILRWIVEDRVIWKEWAYEKDAFDDGDDTRREIAFPLTESTERQAEAALDAHRQQARYADLEVFRGSADEPVAQGEPLQAGRWYLVRVAVRARRRGLPYSGGEPQPLEPIPGDAPARLLVTAEGEGIEVDEPVSELLLPPRGDSTEDAHLRIRPVRKSAGHDRLARLRIRLFHHFNLIETIVLRAEVVGELDDPTCSLLGLSHPLEVKQERLAREYNGLAGLDSRALHVDVRRGGKAGIVLTFTAADEAARKVVLSAPLRLQETDLEDELVAVRELWYQIAMGGSLAERANGDELEFGEQLRKLAGAGRRLWVKLFKRESRGAMFRIGRWLQEHPLSTGSTLQVSLAADARQFVFPWALLYDRPLPRKRWEAPDPEGFWGMRYAVEQLPTPVSANPHVTVDEALQVDVFLWEQFRNVALQNALHADLAQRSDGRLAFSAPPIADVARALERLEACEAHILYFYAHGYTRHRKGDVGAGENLMLFMRRYEQLPPESALRERFRFLYDSIRADTFELDRSWIELSYGKLYLDELYDLVDHLDSGPLVFLNMCESAQVTPLLSESFVHFFLDRGARGVIGTECPMTVEFAHPFSEELLSALLSGQSLGEAVLRARRKFMARRNPLGLAYTAFGRADIRFQPPPLGEPA